MTTTPRFAHVTPGEWVSMIVALGLAAAGMAFLVSIYIRDAATTTCDYTTCDPEWANVLAIMAGWSFALLFAVAVVAVLFAIRRRGAYLFTAWGMFGIALALSVASWVVYTTRVNP